MKIILAPDSFKESMTAIQAADALERGFREVFPDAEMVKLPMADGGEGTVQALVDAMDGKMMQAQVTGPLGHPVEASYGLIGGGKTAIIEMAAASGLHLVPPSQRNPLVTTTRGTGELLRHALDQGVQHIIVGIGGSATNDGGAGMVQALGVRLTDADGKELGAGGGELVHLAEIDTSGMDPRLREVRIEAACDVDNPLTGANGASVVFGPQKGATPAMVEVLDRGLARYATVLKRALGGTRIAELPGAGGAGGLAGGLAAFLGAELRPGVQLVLEAVRFAEQAQGADLVVTGEGRIDGQSIRGKTPVGVAEAARRLGIPVVVVAGTLGPGWEAVHDYGVDAVFSIVPGVVGLPEAIRNAEEYTYRTAAQIARLLRLARS
jgi:glycerate 2-kinase